MIPVHIWTQSFNNNRLGLNFSEYFFEICALRNSLYDKPQVHVRHHRFSHDDVGHFAQIIMSTYNQASIHVFIFSPDDLLKGPTNRVLGDLAALVLQVALLNDKAFVIFLNLSHPKFIDRHSITAITCDEFIKTRCAFYSGQSLVHVPRLTYKSFFNQKSLFSPATLEPLFKDIIEAIEKVKFRDGKLSITNFP